MNELNRNELLDWLASQITTTEIGPDGLSLFQHDLLLPPANSLEESIRLLYDAHHAEDKLMMPAIATSKKGKPTYQLVECERVTIEGYEEYIFGAYTESDTRWRWRVTEMSSGYALCKAQSSKEKAIEKATQNIKKREKKYFQKDIENVRQDMMRRWQLNRTE